MQSLTRTFALLVCALFWVSSLWAQETTSEVDPELSETEPASSPVNTRESASEAAQEPSSISASNKKESRVHHQRFPAAFGAIGIDRTLSATVGVVDTVRLRTGVTGFSTSDFPIEGATNDFIGTELSVGYTPSEFAEIYFSVGGTSNTNSSSSPKLIQTQGDVVIGTKLVGALDDKVSAGVSLNFHLLSDVGAGGFAWNATSAELRGLFSVDLKSSENEPLRLNFNLGYLIENGENLSNGVVGEPSLAQEFGLQTSRYDRLTLGLGLEVPLDEPIVPFVEYEISLPILVELGRRSNDSGDYSFFSVPHSVAAGLRGFVSDNFAIESSVRFGLSDQFYTGVPATPPWLAMLALAYHLDPVPAVVEKTVETEPPVPLRPTLNRGSATVVAKANGKPISGATVTYVNRSNLTPQVTGANGRFVSYALEDGPVKLRISAEGYLPVDAVLTISGENSAPTQITLEKDPNDGRGTLVIITVNENGRTIPAMVQFGGGARDITGRTTARGRYEKTMPAARYPVTVNARGYQEVTRNFVLKPGETTELKVELTALKPIASSPPQVAVSRGGGGGGLATVTKSGIRLKQKVSFVKNTADLTSSGKRVLRSVASGLKRVNQILKVRIEVHTSGRGSASAQQQLSRKRAKNIKAFLQSVGVDRKRLRVRGFGGNKPLAPPITKRGRDKNERVQFTILKVK